MRWLIATHHIDDSKNDIGDDERECQADAPDPHLRGKQTGHDGQRGVQQKPEAAHHHEDLKEAAQVLTPEQGFDG